MATILVVDDNSMLRAVMQRRLARAGFEVLVAANGAEGVEIARAELPDLILMDMTMPVMDGRAATRALRAHPSTQHIPILAFSASATTGHGSPDAVEGDGHIPKPFEFPDLLKKIGELLGAVPNGDALSAGAGA